jgi:hypothetical protein
MRFQPGQSGNLRGKPRGCRHRVTLAAEKLLQGEAEALTRKAIELGLAGDVTALRLCLDRIVPHRKGRPVRFTMPTLRTPGDLVMALGIIARAVGHGELTPEEGQAVAAVLNAQRQAIELVAIERRLGALEARHEPST